MRRQIARLSPPQNGTVFAVLMSVTRLIFGHISVVVERAPATSCRRESKCACPSRTSQP